MVQVPGGSFVMGTRDAIISSSRLSDMLPNSSYAPHQVILGPFRISKFEVEASLFYEFLLETGKNIFDQSNIYNSLLIRNEDQYAGYPAVSSYLYALDFCKWLSDKHGTFYRLLTEAEWEYAVTGGDDRKYPWGNNYQSLSADGKIPQRIPLASYDDDRSPFGVMNMFATTKRRSPYWHKYFSPSPNENIGFRIVDDTADKLFMTNNGEISYFYEVVQIEEDSNIYLYPDRETKVLGRVYKGESIQCLFKRVHANGSIWLRIQNSVLSDTEIFVIDGAFEVLLSSGESYIFDGPREKNMFQITSARLIGDYENFYSKAEYE
jgi:hypothetical protein